MCQVTALVEIHSHQCIAGLKDRELNGKVSLSAGMGLNVRVVASKQLLGSLDRQSLDLIDDPAAAIIAFS